MGGAQSKVENEESVSRCKDRMNLLREVVIARNAFASRRSGYAMALRNTGAALCDYALGEAADVYHPHLGGTRSPPLVKQPLPPPPLPVVPPPPPESKMMSWDYFFGIEEDDDVIHEEDDHHLQLRQNETKSRGIIDTVNSDGDGDNGVMDVRSRSLNLLKILGEIDDYFLKAFDSVQEVSKIEAARLHYRSIFANNRGHFGRVSTRNRSFRGAPNGENRNDEEKYETHATVLDKLLAGEKKLYEGVKARELVKLEYQRKVLLLNKLKKQGATPKSVEKTKAAVSHLHTRYIIHSQSLDSTVLEVNDIRDTQLCPRLVALVDGMSKMWDSMCEHHGNQLKVVAYLRYLDVSRVPKETTFHHYERTVQLYYVVQSWHWDFENLVTQQKNYVQALDNWLKLNLVSNESSVKEKISSPQCVQTPPIQTLLHLWLDHLQKLPDEDVKCAIVSFAAVIKTFINDQEEERKLKERCEKTRKKLSGKIQAFENSYREFVMGRGPLDETDQGQVTGPDPIAERHFAVLETLKKKHEDEIEAHQKLCVQVREKSLESLKIRLPELFRAMLDYAHVCRDSYQQLRSMVHSQNL